MFLQLRFRVERTARVIEVDLAAFIQAAIFRCAQVVQQGCFLVVRETRDEIRARFLDLKFFWSARLRHISHIIPSAPALRPKVARNFPSLKVVLAAESQCSLSCIGMCKRDLMPKG